MKKGSYQFHFTTVTLDPNPFPCPIQGADPFDYDPSSPIKLGQGTQGT